MNKLLNEQEVLQSLNIPNFRHLSKENVIEFASKLSDMQPEVAIKALEQFPEFSKTILELADDYMESISKGFDANSESMRLCTSILQSIKDSLENQFQRDDISFEEKKYYVEKMFEVAQLQMAKDSENKEFIVRLLQLTGGAAVVLGSVALVALGGKGNIKLPFKK